jgi:DNA-binding transcriptional LysR family regulator
MTLIALLESGDAISVVPASGPPSSGPFAERFRVIPLDVEQPRATISAFWSTRRPPAPASRELIRLLRELVQDRPLVQDGQV